MDYKNLIKKTGLKKSKIAEKMGITPVYFSYLLSGTKSFTPQMEDKLKSILAQEK